LTYSLVFLGVAVVKSTQVLIEPRANRTFSGPTARDRHGCSAECLDDVGDRQRDGQAAEQ